MMRSFFALLVIGLFSQIAFAQALSSESIKYKQLITHFDKSDTRTFDQRVFIDSQFSSNLSDPILLYICGEGPCESDELKKSIIPSYAKQLSAKIVIIEHRYYGQSQPFTDWSTVHLKFLTVENETEDLASVIKSLKAERSWTGSWVAFGGSYAGGLSAFLRLKHPELVDGAVASSALAKAKLNYPEFDQKTALKLGPECASDVRTLIQSVENTWTNPAGEKHLKEIFEMPSADRLDDLLSIIGEGTGYAVQYGKREEFCKSLRASKDSLSTFAEQIIKMLAIIQLMPENDGAAKMMSIEVSDDGSRPWMYQSCTEFGYFDTAYRNRSESAQSPRLNIHYYLELCRRAFGNISITNITSYNDSYYDQFFKTSVSNILFTSGSEDPWSLVSLNVENGNDSNTHLNYRTLVNESHCADLKAINDPEVLKAQSETLNLIKNWLVH